MTGRAPSAPARRIGAFVERAYGIRGASVAHDPRGARVHVQVGAFAGEPAFSLWVPATRQGWATAHRLCERARLAAIEASKTHARHPLAP